MLDAGLAFQTEMSASGRPSQAAGERKYDVPMIGIAVW
jgi:hypothetical protein